MQIFISYSSQDVDFADRLDNDLTRRGYTVWRDRTSLKGGSDWEAEIHKALKRSHAVVALISQDAIASRWVAQELGIARNRNVKIYPLSLTQGTIHPDLGQLNHIPADDYAAGLMQLLDALPKRRPVTAAPIWLIFGVFALLIVVSVGIFLLNDVDDGNASEQAVVTDEATEQVIEPDGTVEQARSTNSATASPERPTHTRTATVETEASRPSSEAEPTSTPTDTPEASAVAVFPDGIRLAMLYDDPTLFTLRIEGDDPEMVVDLSSLRFVWDGEEEEYNLEDKTDWQQLNMAEIQVGTCLQIRPNAFQEPDYTIANCDIGPYVENDTFLGPTTTFWQPRNNAQFSVYWGADELTICQVVEATCLTPAGD